MQKERMLVPFLQYKEFIFVAFSKINTRWAALCQYSANVSDVIFVYVGLDLLDDGLNILFFTRVFALQN
jgi:hypothetical protein